MRFRGLFLAACFALMAVSSAAHAAVAADAVLGEAAAALARGQNSQADTLLSSALGEAGLDLLQKGRLLVARAMARQAMGSADDALVDYTRALSNNALPAAERGRALYNRGLVLDGQGRLANAIGDYSASLALVPDAFYALNNRANAYRRQGKLAEARRDYLASLAAGNTAPEYPYFGLGQVAEAGGEADAARDYYAKAVAANPGYSLAQDRLRVLGGVPHDTISPPEERIVLRPPAPRAAEATTPSAFIPAQDGPPIVLRPPPKRRAAAPVQPDPPARPGQGAPLRSTIMEDGPPVASAPAPQPGALVQLGAWRSEAEARDGWAKAQARSGQLLAGLEPRIVAVDLPGRGRYYRLRVPVSAPARLCTALQAMGQDCIPVRD